MKLQPFFPTTLPFLFLLLLLLQSCQPLKPVITDVDRKSGIPGTIVEIKGSGFNPLYHQNEVTVGNGSTKVISSTATSIRFVLLRDIKTGPIVVKNLANNNTDTSDVEFVREGSTMQATPLQDSDAELVQGLTEISMNRYDMNAQGTNQPILIVLAQPADIINPDSNIYFDITIASNARDYLVQRAMQANTFFQQASYNKTSANFVVTPGWIPLSQVRDFYMWQGEDVTRAQTAVDGANAEKQTLLLDPSTTQAQLDAADAKIAEKEALLKTANDQQGMVQEPEFYYAEALIGAKAAVGNFNDFGDYVVVCAGPFLRGSCCWREEGFHAESSVLGLNFDIDFNAQKGLTYTAQGTHWGRLGHELSHFFSGGDLYGSGTTVGTFEGFDFMGNHDNGPLYGGYNMEKRLGYFHGNNIATETWGSSATHSETYDIVAHANSQNNTGDGVVNLLSIKVTDAMYYHVEVRQRPDATLAAPNNYIFDANINVGSPAPAWNGGVVISRAIESNNQNNNQERYIQLMPPTRILQVGDVVSDPARTIRITVESKLADRPLKYRVRLEWGTLPAADPNGQYDLRISPWTPPPWESVDIWANSPKNDQTSPAKIIYKNHEPGDDTKPIGNGDPPWVDHNNKIFAHIYNNGSVPTPEPVRVTFYINTPPGVGDDGNWGPFDEVNLGILPANFDTIVMSTKNWVPSVDEHTCVKVYIQPMTGEITFDNNQAQENFNEFESASGSPFKPVEFVVDVRNPYDKPVIMDMKARNVPKFWNVAMEHGSIYLEDDEVRRLGVVIWSDMDDSAISSQANTNEKKYNRKPAINIEGWVNEREHNFFAVGGVTALVQSVQSSKIDIKPFYRERRIGGTGQVTPAKSGVPIAVHAVGPDGLRHSVMTTTGVGGNYNFTLTSADPFKPGSYQVIGYLLPGSTLASAETAPVTVQIQ